MTSARPARDRREPSMRARVAIFVAVCVVAAVVAVAAVLMAQRTLDAAIADVPTVAISVGDDVSLGSEQPMLLFEHTALGD